ncbi:hypothetical protein HDU87_000657 [Geranomyces variabilis]|uniref:Uncharacterized protein n=1 Tax=Geranomyces variabilis TaxID=109894 RepID=A0AAD5TCL0_9FUNG|nr:hypothetical protein HDU87_000657 [Geranomyces variabilis]
MQTVIAQSVQQAKVDQERIIAAKSEALAAYKLQVTMAKQLGKKEIAAERRLNLLKDRLRATNQELGESRGTVSNRTKLEAVADIVKRELRLPVSTGVKDTQHFIKIFEDEQFPGISLRQKKWSSVPGQYAVIRELFLELAIPFTDVQEEMDAEIDVVKTAEISEAEDGGADI